MLHSLHLDEPFFTKIWGGIGGMVAVGMGLALLDCFLLECSRNEFSVSVSCLFPEVLFCKRIRSSLTRAGFSERRNARRSDGILGMCGDRSNKGDVGNAIGETEAEIVRGLLE